MVELAHCMDPAELARMVKRVFVALVCIFGVPVALVGVDVIVEKVLDNLGLRQRRRIREIRAYGRGRSSDRLARWSRTQPEAPVPPYQIVFLFPAAADCYVIVLRFESIFTDPFLDAFLHLRRPKLQAQPADTARGRSGMRNRRSSARLRRAVRTSLSTSLSSMALPSPLRPRSALSVISSLMPCTGVASEAAIAKIISARHFMPGFFGRGSPTMGSGRIGFGTAGGLVVLHVLQLRTQAWPRFPSALNPLAAPALEARPTRLPAQRLRASAALPSNIVLAHSPFVRAPSATSSKCGRKVDDRRLPRKPRIFWRMLRPDTLDRR